MAYKLVMTIERSGFVYSAVPAKWECEQILRWPQHLNSKNLDKLRANPNSIPDENWTYSECVVKAVANTFIEGRQLEIQFSNFSNTETEEFHLQQVQQNKRIRKRATFTNLNQNVNNLFDHPSSIVESTSENEAEREVQDSVNNINTKETSIINIDNEINLGQIMMDFQLSVSNFTSQIETFGNRMDKLDKSVAEINVKLDKLLEKPSNDNDVSLHDTNAELLENYKFPLQNIHDVEKMNSHLSSDKEFKSQLISGLARIGGSSKTADGGKLIYKLIDFLFEPELMVKFSWTGSSKSSDIKLSFQKYSMVVDVIYEVIHLADCRHSKARNEEYLRDKILKHTLQRLERKRKNKVKFHSTKFLKNENVPSDEKEIIDLSD